MTGKTIFVTKSNKTSTFKVRDAEVADDVDVVKLLKETPAYVQGKGGDVLESNFVMVKSKVAGHGRGIIPTGNGFVYAVVEAYNKHYDLEIRPDDVWIAIMTQFSLYLNANAEELRHHFVDFEGQRELVAYQGASLRTADYGALIDQITVKIGKNLKDDSVREWATVDFSTTTDDDRTASQVVLMGAMQKYFKYEFCLLCGIPKITILGTRDDWAKLKMRITKLADYGADCEKWAAMLHAIVDEFLAVVDDEDIGDAIAEPKNLHFWQTICSYTPTGSGPTYLSGWITAFCVFDGKGAWQGGTTKVRTWNGRTIGNGTWPVIDSEDIPTGYVTVPVIIDDGERHEALLFAGHLAFLYEPAQSETSEKTEVGSCLRPQVIWAVVLCNGPESAIDDYSQSAE